MNFFGDCSVDLSSLISTTRNSQRLKLCAGTRDIYIYIYRERERERERERYKTIPNLSYHCNIVWAMAYKTNLHRLVKSHFNVHTDPNFEELGILKFNYIHLLQLGQFMYSSKNAVLPPWTISPKAINSTLTTQEIPRPTVYRIVKHTLRRSRHFSQSLSSLEKN